MTKWTAVPLLPYTTSNLPSTRVIPGGSQEIHDIGNCYTINVDTVTNSSLHELLAPHRHNFVINTKQQVENYVLETDNAGCARAHAHILPVSLISVASHSMGDVTQLPQLTGQQTITRRRQVSKCRCLIESLATLPCPYNTSPALYRLVLVVMACHSLSLYYHPILRHYQNTGHQLLLMDSAPATRRPRGRAMRLHPSPDDSLANNCGIY